MEEIKLEYDLFLNPRPFKAIKAGTKKIEGRTVTEYDKHVPFDKLVKGDIFNFTNLETNEKMKVLILGVKHYKDVRTMLEIEGTKRVLSSGGTVNDGIENYNKLEGYKENIPKYGIYAIEVKYLE